MKKAQLDISLGIIGLGYVGMPLAVAFAKRFPTLGYDVDVGRVDQLKRGHDASLEVSTKEIKAASQLRITSDVSKLSQCNVYIVTVPTPVDTHNKPDFRPLLSASMLIGEMLSKGDLVVYESTVYPGATEEKCVSELERVSGLVFNQDFSVGYSPERINPGDNRHKLKDIVKVTSGSNPAAAEKVDEIYRQIISAGTHRASSIKVAEAAKIIENVQRDVNIALINELAVIFERLDIDTAEVLAAANTKWNFLPFYPGLVGGHCIGVDPYYLTQKAQDTGYHPEMILAGRRINDNMGAYVAGQIIKLMIRNNCQVGGGKILVLGLAFKENCPDLRNTKVVDVIAELGSFGATVDVYDPWVDSDRAFREYGLTPVTGPDSGEYDAIVLAVAHRQFRDMNEKEIRSLGKSGAVIYDVKSVWPVSVIDGRL